MRKWDGFIAVLYFILRRRKYFSLFLASGILYGLLFALLTNLIDIRSGLSNVSISFTWTSLSFFLVLSILGGLFIALQIFAVRQKQKMKGSTSTGITGAVVSFFATTCPFCKPLLLSLLGITGFSGSLILLKYGIAFAIGSILLLLLSIYFTIASLVKCGCCTAKKSGGK